MTAPAVRTPPGRAAFGWYGSKSRLGLRIAALASGIPHQVYLEPYAGSAAVLFAKPRVPVEIINDLDGQVVNFFRELRDRPAELARACRSPRTRPRIALTEPGDRYSTVATWPGSCRGTSAPRWPSPCSCR